MGERRLAYIDGERPMCEMGDEDGCLNEATHWLHAPRSYVIPLACCPDHAAEEEAMGATVEEVR